MPDHNYFANLIWQIADLLRGPYRPPQYERVMLPMTVLRRFDCVLASTKARVLAEHARRKGGKVEGTALDVRLNRAAGQRFHNRSPLDFQKLKGDPDNVERHLVSYINGFSGNVRDIFEFFEFENEIERMREANILYLVVSKFSDVDLHPGSVPNEQMGLIFENLIRRFNELANETAGDHFTPREVIRLMVSILFIQDDKLLATPGTVRKLLDPACGTGGMLAEAQNYLREHHGAARLFIDESTSRNHLRWLYWLLQTLRLDEGTDEVAVPGLNRETVYSRDVLVPPLPKQRAIADFLDRKMARLDTLIAPKERVLALLAEKRRALITHTVTHGLNPHAPLRYSGIPWLGKTPTHWKIVALRFLVDMTSVVSL